MQIAYSPSISHYGIVQMSGPLRISPLRPNNCGRYHLTALGPHTIATSSLSPHHVKMCEMNKGWDRKLQVRASGVLERPILNS